MSDCSFCGTPFAPGTATCPRCGNSPGGDGQPATVGKGPSSRLPFFVIVVGVFFLIGAFSIPNLTDALQRAKQKRTVAELHGAEAVTVSSARSSAGAPAPGQSPEAIRPTRERVFEPGDVPEYEELTPETTTVDWIIEFEEGFLSPPSERRP